jgi:hypothetical protein
MQQKQNKKNPLSLFSAADVSCACISAFAGVYEKL